MRGLPALLLVLALGCEQPATQLVVVVDTDYAVPDAMNRVHATIRGPDGEVRSSHEFALAGDAGDSPTRFAVPFSFGVVPAGDDADRRVTVEVTGHGPGREEPLVTRRAITGFLPGRALRLPMFLPRACEDVECPREETCARGGMCISAVVSPKELTVVAPGEEFSDGGMDAQAGDAAPMDGGGERRDRDAALPMCPSPCDSGCEEIACTTGETCTCHDVRCHCLLSCPAGGCETSCQRSTCIVDARDTDELTASCGSGATCRIAAHGSSTAEVTCEASSQCDVACGGADRCRVECRAGASCVLRCDGASSCQFSSCMVGQMSCDGGVQVCNRSCP